METDLQRLHRVVTHWPIAFRNLGAIVWVAERDIDLGAAVSVKTARPTTLPRLSSSWSRDGDPRAFLIRSSGGCYVVDPVRGMASVLAKDLSHRTRSVALYWHRTMARCDLTTCVDRRYADRVDVGLYPAERPDPPDPVTSALDAAEARLTKHVVPDEERPLLLAWRPRSP